MSLALTIAVAALCQPPSDDDIKAVVAKLNAYRDLQIERLESKREETAKQRMPAAEKREQLAKIDSAIAGLLAHPSFPTLDPLNVKLGDVGRFPETVTVIQIIDATSLLVRPRRTEVRYVPGNLAASEVVHDGEPLILRNIDTTGIVDGREVRLTDVYYAKGTESYETALGAKKTVFFLLAFTPAALVDLLAVRKPPEPRKWTDATGKFSVIATFQGANGELATLLKEDGSTIAIPLDKLSEADRKWIREH